MKYITQIPNIDPDNYRGQIPIQMRVRAMRPFGFWGLVFFVLLGFGACSEGQTAEVSAAKQPDALVFSRPLYQSPTFLSDATGKTVQIAADSTSYDEQFGDSYRVLRVLKNINGREIELSRQLLPVNASPDFRYRFADVYAKDEQEWVVIQGHYFFFVYDVVNDRLSDKILPPKPKGFEAADAQSGRITTLAFEGNRLKGVAQDIGAFYFPISRLRQEMR